MENNKVKNELDTLSLWVILGGVLLLSLLPVGIYLGFDNWFFKGMFLAQLIVQIFGVYVSVKYFFGLTQGLSASFGLYRILLIPFFAVCAVCTILPITARDALIHHLYVPKMWLQAGSIIEIPWHEWSYYPQLIQLGYAGLGSLGLRQLSSLYHYSFLLLLGAVVAAFVKRRFEAKTLGVFAFLVTISMPALIKLGTEPLVDIPLALYVAVAFALLVEACEVRFAGQRVLGAGVALGLAFATKYNGLLAGGVLIFTFILYALQSRVSIGATLRIVIFLGLTSVATYSPWLIRNATLKGNPIYPLFSSFFSPSVIGTPTDEAAAKMSPLEQRMYLYGEEPTDIIAMPFKMILAGQDDDPAKFDGVLSPILLIFFIGLIPASRKPWGTWAFIFTVVYFVAALYFSSARIRYLTPLWLPFLAITFMGLEHLRQIFPRRGQQITTVLIWVHLIWSGYYSYNLIVKKDVCAYLRNSESPDSYLGRFLFEYDLIKKVNVEVAKNSNPKIYLLGTGNRFFYYSVPVVGGHFSERDLLVGIRQSKTVDDLANWAKAQGYTHLLVHRDRATALLISSMTQEQIKLWQEFITKKLSPRISFRGYSLLEIKYG